MDFTELRQLMVDLQLASRGIKDERVLAAMRKVPRHLFIGHPFESRAYDDSALSIGEGQTISQPYMVALMTELLELTGEEKVLEIGTGSGYQAAILSELAREVHTVERIDSLAEQAMEKLQSLGYPNIQVHVGDGTLGWSPDAPYNAIIVTAGTPDVPPPLKEQLSENGILVAPVGDRYSQQLIKIRKRHNTYTEEYNTPCVFVPLIGKYGWTDTDQGVIR